MEISNINQSHVEEHVLTESTQCFVDMDNPRLGNFSKWLEEDGIELYPYQHQSINHLLSGDNVVLSTPTGSGKSLVAFAGAFMVLAANKRAAYTAPTKALVNEKFFALVNALGADNVGLITGDASVNSEAPVIACTAEILAQQALRMGCDTPVDLVVMDEFHYYGDRDRGWAWQVPLLELRKAQFLLMSATLGDTTFLRGDLEKKTGRDAVLVEIKERPVPLKFQLRNTSLVDSIKELWKTDRLPAYVVHFAQRDATQHAINTSFKKKLRPEEKLAIQEAIDGYDFSTSMGKTLRRALLRGVGIHHAGMLPRYRLLVERLAQQGLLKVICGTDTLGVGINVPIRTVLFTQLYKYNGKNTKLLTSREFQQIAGRAGRNGYDTVGNVWVQSPKRVYSERDQDKYIAYNENTVKQLWNDVPKALESSFNMTHSMILNVLRRPGNGKEALNYLLTENHETKQRNRMHAQKIEELYRSLVDTNIVKELEESDEFGRYVTVDLDMRDRLSLDQPLSLFLLEVVKKLDRNDEEYSGKVLALVESILEDPRAILNAQKYLARDLMVDELKSTGDWYDFDFESKMELLDEAEPEAHYEDWTRMTFRKFAKRELWARSLQPRPKSVAHEIIDDDFDFNQYVRMYDLEVSEGLLLKYLTDCYKTLVQTVPSSAMNPKLEEVARRLKTIISTVDSSLLDEWEKMRSLDKDQRRTEP